MVNRFFEEMKHESPTFTSTVGDYKFDKDEAKQLLVDLETQWEMSDGNTFLFYTPKKDPLSL